MQTRFTNLNISFTICQYNFHVLKLATEKFTESIPAHYHSSNSYEIHYISQGYGTVTIEGKTQKVEPGSLYVTGPYIVHEQIPDPAFSMCEYSIYIKIEKNKTTPFDFVELFARETSWIGMDSQEALPLLQSVFYELNHRESGYQTYVTSLLQQFIIKMIRNYAQGSVVGDSMRKDLILSDERSVTVEESFLYDYKTLTLEMLAKRLGMSKRQTERFLMANYKRTFQQKKMEAKMSAASVLLKGTDKTIAQISEELGYSCPENFSPAFKKVFGVSPRGYRKKRASRFSNQHISPKMM